MIRRRAHPRALALLMAAACALTGSLTGCSVIGDMLPAPVRSVAPLPASALGDVTDVGGLLVGDCLREVSEGLQANAATVPRVPCGESHEFEVFARFPVLNGAFPGDNAVTAAAESGCGSRFEAFVQLDYRVSTLDFAYLTPTEESWGAANGSGSPSSRDVSCLVTDPAGPVTGTLAGAAR